jgi:glycyl-tRNA synthetase beta chain
VIRLLIENKLDLQLSALISDAATTFGDLLTHPLEPLHDFVMDRLAGNLKDQGYSAQEVDAVLSLNIQCLADIPARLQAVRAFAQLPEAAALAAANKRISNILKKAEGAQATVNEALLKDPAEQSLFQIMGPVLSESQECFDQGNYQAALKALAVLRESVDAFFADVMVNADDPELKANRLGLLATLHGAMNQVADLSRLSA